MRVLVSTTAGSGHFGPLVPFAEALQAAGHVVAVAAPESFAPAVQRAGFDHLGFADADPQEVGAVFGSLGGLSNDEGNTIVVREIFGRLDTRAALPGMKAIVEDWRPDLILRESCEFASYLVGEAAGLPHVHVAVGLASFGVQMLAMVEEPLTELGAEPGLTSLLAAPTLTLVPQSLEGGVPTPGAHRYREAISVSVEGSEPLPAWWDDDADPLVYVTFGSVAGGMGLFPDFYQAVITALADLPVRILLTIGDAGDPDVLGPAPPNIHVERWWSQKAVMPHATAMIGHGGFGTTMLGLAFGVPMVVVPLFADQPYNARRVEAVGAGIVVDGGVAAAGALPEAVQRLLSDDSFRVAANRIAGEIAELPPVSASVPYLERLVR